ncbi:Ser/Thr protein kinase RdoA (MazF antagonist) [Stella humosa]|uniref:Ser/Thr protein kinase RdoA (MazF antagonist) n=1 Tax=Stella humosa TaxID=94 RepID=A0A3N1KQQ6_9PROT|nr:aminoglycoside phosphotransferase [Stella humosa]ROP84133.1 Ser/Thr protein kinase RdoA (MazF antagonist) [Stella humosa]BBK33643.1 hypothetical protein STHU_42770 [Stella humosa]
MPLIVDLDRLHAAIVRLPGMAGVAPDALSPLAAGGVAHDHVRILGTGLLARVPRVSQMAMAARDNLLYQAECFRRLAASGATPRLAGVIEPGCGLPMGALLVEDVAGRPARVPADLPAIATALAAIHRLPVPAERAPLVDHTDPVAGTWAVIQGQAVHFAAAPASAAVRAALDAECAWAAALVAAPPHPPAPRTLVGTDTHPGNFLIAGDGRAMFVDAEKALYGTPAIDIAHVTLATSVLWSAPDATPVGAADILAFERAWLAELPADLGNALRPWVRPMRRLTWLRSMSWFARWWVLSRDDPAWSAAALDAGLADHIRGRVRQFFTDAMVEAVRAEWLGPDPLPAP